MTKYIAWDPFEQPWALSNLCMIASQFQTVLVVAAQHHDFSTLLDLVKKLAKLRKTIFGLDNFTLYHR